MKNCGHERLTFIAGHYAALGMPTGHPAWADQHTWNWNNSCTKVAKDKVELADLGQWHSSTFRNIHHPQKAPASADRRKGPSALECRNNSPKKENYNRPSAKSCEKNERKAHYTRPPSSRQYFLQESYRKHPAKPLSRLNTFLSLCTNIGSFGSFCNTIPSRDISRHRLDHLVTHSPSRTEDYRQSPIKHSTLLIIWGPYWVERNLDTARRPPLGRHQILSAHLKRPLSRLSDRVHPALFAGPANKAE